MPGRSTADNGSFDRPSPANWFRRFRRRYDEAASDPVAELGVFYERHRNFVYFHAPPDSHRIEYTDVEWSQVMSIFLSRLAREFGLYQTWGWDGDLGLAWLRPGATWQLSTVIEQADEARGNLVAEKLQKLLASSAELSVLLLYPDYPLPDGAGSVGEATETWRMRVEATLARHSPKREFLLVAISSNAWAIPAPWNGFVWNPRTRALDRVP